MGRLSRGRHHKGEKPFKSKYKTKRKTKDLDEIQQDMEPANAKEILEKRPIDLDLPGNGQHYCLHCA